MKYIYMNMQTGLTDSDVMSIRMQASKLGTSITEIAKTFQLGKSTVSDIVNRKTWKHVPEAKPVKGFSDYMILPDGRVWSLKSNQCITPRLTQKEGLKVELSNNGKRKSVSLANLVAKAFISSNKTNIKFNDNDRLNVHFKNIKV